MSKVFKQETANTSGESLTRRALRGLGQLARGALTDIGTAPQAKGKPVEALSFFDAPAPDLPLTDELDHLDAFMDEGLIVASQAHIKIHQADV